MARIEAPDLQTSAQVPASQNSTYDPYGEFDKDAIIFDNDGHHIIRNVDELDISQAEKDAINNKLWNRWNWSNWGAGTYYSLAEQYVRAGVKVVRLPRDWSPPPRPSAVAVPTPPVQIPAVPAPPVVLQVIEQAVESQEGVGQFIDGLGQSIGKSGERANSWSHVLGSTAGTLLVGAVVSAGIGAGLTALGIAGAPAVTVAAIVIGVGFLGYHAYQTYSHWDDLNGYERVESVLNPLAGLLGGWLAPRGPIMSLPRFNWQPAPQLSFAGVGSSGSSAGAISIAGSIRIINSATGAQTASAGFLGTYVFSTTGGGNGPKVEGEAPKVEVGKDVSDKSFIGTRISLQKQKRHLPDSVDGERGYMLSVADAQKVVDEFHNGNAKVISFDKLQNEVVVQVTSVTGIHRYKNGTVVKESNVFVIAGKGHSVKVYPTDPALGL